MTPTERLFTLDAAFDDTEEARGLFVQAMREMVRWHRERSALYAGLCRLDGFDEESVRTEDDLPRIPHVIVSAFKERRLLSIPEEEVVITYTSSGTSGHQSHIDWDATSRDRQDFMRRAIVKSYGLVDLDHPVNYLCFSYDPDSGGQRGAAHAHSMYATFAPAQQTYYAISAGPDGQPKFRLDGCVQALDSFSATGLPLRVTGFPAFGYVTLKSLDEAGHRFRFPPESVLFSGGGWKLHTGEAVSNEEYAALVERVLGIPRTRIHDVYGMVEHGVPYMTCERGNFHVPIWARVYAVDPGTGRILPDGQVGLFKLLTPYLTSTPAISVLSTDLGATRSDCPCGRGGKLLELHGRGGVKKYDGCAISAAQLLGQ